jgi:hypothetical protein
MRNASIGVPVLSSDEFLCILDKGLDNPIEEDDRAEWATTFAFDVVPDEAGAIAWLVGYS